MQINIAEGLNLPIDAVTQTFAQIGRKGAGKTYLASMIAEQMLDAQAQVIVIDPIGNWWGLRVDADGVSKGKEVYVMGGLNGDVSLSPESGKEIAKILTEKNISVVLDVSEFRKNQRKRFITDFAEEFYHLKKAKPSPVHIFLEESQKFVPQRVMKDDARMLGAWEDIVRLGRNCGIGCSLISQRPQSINKEVLSQVECLCVLQITGLHERKALEEWIQEAGSDRKIIGLLPSLNTGEGYVWSPAWLKVFKKVKFNKKTTMDTSATPELGKAMKTAKLSKMDIEKLQKFITDVTEKTAEELKTLNDYKNKVIELKKELRIATHSKPKPIADEKALERARQQGFREAEKDFMKEIIFLRNENSNLIKLMNKIGSLLNVKQIPRPEYSFKPKTLIETRESIVKHTSNTPIQKALIKPQLAPNEELMDDGGIRLGLCPRKIYSVLFGNQDTEFTKVQLGLLSGYSAKSSGFSNSLSKLNTMGLIKRNGGKISINEINEEYATEETIGISRELWSRKLGLCSKKMFEFLLENEHEEFDKEYLANAVGYSAISSGFSNSLSKLNSLGLIKRNDGLIQLNQELMEI